MNYYQILGISYKSSSNEIKAAYKKLAIKCHPDKHLDENTNKEYEEKFKQISEAYQILSDPCKKKNYDLFEQVNLNNLQDPSDLFKSIFESLPPDYIEKYSIFLDRLVNSPEIELTKKVFEKHVPENKYYNSFKNIIEYINENINLDIIRNYHQTNNTEKKTSTYTFQNINKSTNRNINEQQDVTKNQKIFRTHNNKEQEHINENQNLDKESDIIKIEDNTNNIYFKDNHLENNKTSNIITTIIITLEELYKKEVKKIDINRIRKNTEGNYVKEKKTFIIPVSCEKIIFKNEADQLPNYTLTGDIIIYIKIATHPLYQRLKNNNLLLNIDVSLYEYYYGTIKKITFLDYSSMLINSGQNLHKANIKKIRCKGLPFDENKFGDLYIKFNLRLPNLDLNDNKVNKILFSYFNNNNNNNNNNEEPDYGMSFFLDTDTFKTSVSNISILSSSQEESLDSEM